MEKNITRIYKSRNLILCLNIPSEGADVESTKVEI